MALNARMGDFDSQKILSRPVITGPNMYSLLIREFARLKSPDCVSPCRVPLPFWGPAPGSDGYWYMETPPSCPHGCNRVLAVLWAKLTTEYKLAPPDKEQAKWKQGVRMPMAPG